MAGRSPSPGDQGEKIHRYSEEDFGSSYVLEKVSIDGSDEEDDFNYEEVRLDDVSSEGEDEDSAEAEDLQAFKQAAAVSASKVVAAAAGSATITTTAPSKTGKGSTASADHSKEGTAGGAVADDDKPPEPTAERKRESVDDFVRNYLTTVGFTKTMESFQTEWYEHLQKGTLHEDQKREVDDLYSTNQELIAKIQDLQAEMAKQKEVITQQTTAIARLKKERDYHRLHHKRTQQEKGKLMTEISRLGKKFEEREPELAALKTRFENTHRELMALKVDRDALQRKNEELVNALKSMAPPNTASSRNLKAGLTSAPGTVPSTANGTPSLPPTGQTLPPPVSSPGKPAVSGGSAGKTKVTKTKKLEGTPGTKDMPTGNRPNPYAEGSDFKALLLEPSSLQNDRTTRAHTAPVSAVCAHPRRPIAVTVSDDTTWRMWRLPEVELVMSGDGHRDWIADCSFHPAGTHLATCSGDSTVKIWDFARECCSATFNEHTQPVWGVAFHDTGDFVATASMDHSAKLLDLTTRKCKQALRGHLDSVNCIQFQPYTNHACTCSADKTVSMWDVRVAECLKTFFGHSASCSNLSFNLRGDTCVSTDTDGDVRLWDLRMVKQRMAINFGPYSANKALFDHSGTFLFVASDDGSIKVHDIIQDKPVAELKGHEDAVQGLAFISPSCAASLGRPILLSAGSDGTLRSWSLPI